MKIVITGALGHIGSKFIRSLPLVFNNPEIILIDDLSTQRYASLFNLPANATYRFLEAKVQELNLENIFTNADAVVHLAAITDASGTADKPDLVYNNNLTGTEIVAKACLKTGVPMIFPSSTSVYGSQSCLVDENCQELKPQSPYAESKLLEENLLLNLAKEGLKVFICRLGTIYGTSIGMRFHTAVNKFCWQAVMGVPLTVWETALHQKRPYLDLDDASNAFAFIIKNKLYDGSVYNIVSSNHTVNDVIEEIKQNVTDVNISLVSHKIMNQLSYEVSSKKFNETGFVFNGSLTKSVADTIKLLANANGNLDLK